MFKKLEFTFVIAILMYPSITITAFNFITDFFIFYFLSYSLLSWFWLSPFPPLCLFFYSFGFRIIGLFSFFHWFRPLLLEKINNLAQYIFDITGRQLSFFNDTIIDIFQYFILIKFLTHKDMCINLIINIKVNLIILFYNMSLILFTTFIKIIILNIHISFPQIQQSNHFKNHSLDYVEASPLFISISVLFLISFLVVFPSHFSFSHLFCYLYNFYLLIFIDVL